MSSYMSDKASRDPLCEPVRSRAGLVGRVPVRWLIASLLLALSVLNYVDRQALSILATDIQRDLGLTDTDYARIVQAFLLCYTAAYLINGRIVDRIGARLAETAFVTWWSIANMLTALASGFGSLLAFRSLLGLGEPGHYAVSAKVVGQWFPPREKGIAVGLYTMGGTLGAALAAPLVTWLMLRHSWQAAFVITGAAGLVLAAIWWFVYRPPNAHPWMGERERAHLSQHGLLDAAKTSAKPVPLRDLVRWKPLWVVMGVRVITDPVWYFYLVWFAKYLREQRGFTAGDVGGTLWVVFVAADIGCLLAGVLAGMLIHRGVIAVKARLRVMACAAAVLSLSFMVPLGGNVWALGCASLFACCVMLFMTCAVALPIDLFPATSLGSVQGLIGMGGSLGGMFSTGLVATVIGAHSYDTVFIAMSFLHPLAAVLLLILLPRFIGSFKTS
jgi:MFS transporter, ACS family, hexuronate transporter